MAPSLSDSSSAWDMKSFVVDEGHGVKGLAEMNFKTLPSQYIQPPSERLDLNTVSHEESIPVIDMLNWDEQKIAEAICHAAEKWGFFQIINHGVPAEVLDNVKRATHRFFELPAHEKKRHLYENSPTKNVRFGTSFIPQAEKALEWKDYLSCFYVSDDEATIFWPSACRDEMLEYMKKSEPVINKLVDMLMGGLNVTEVDEENRLILTGSKRININYYPKCPNPELAIGVGRHSDVSTLTILLQDDIGGLYVRKLETDAWIHVQPISGSLIINVGDALQIISNGRYKSVEHRVVASGSHNRISVPIFVNPRPSDVIRPLRQLVEGGEKALYRQVLYSDYVKHFFRKAHDGKGTVDFVKLE